MKYLSLLAAFVLSYTLLNGQETTKDMGKISGNFEMTTQYYNVDTLIGAPIVPEKLRMNGFCNVIYTKDKFRAGIRYESYQKALQGFPVGYDGNGIPFRYVGYTLDNIDITVGNFYEQFGQGMIFRTYEERGLGYDNAMDGIRIKYNPYKGVYLKGIIGKQRIFFDSGPGIVRGIDGEINLTELIHTLDSTGTQVRIGGSFVSKYQSDTDPLYVLPENVGSYSARASIYKGKFSLTSEYAYKINDPSADNKFIYKPGQALIVSAAYSKKGFGINLSAKTIDNMSYRSNRNEGLNNLLINYLPALTRQHTYNLAATLYPYATQLNGEVSFQGDLFLKLQKGTKLGGKYGTNIAINYAEIHSLNKHTIDAATDTTRQGYSARFFNPGNIVYFKDFNIEISKKINKHFKFKLMYMNLVYNMTVVQGLEGTPTVYADIAVFDGTFKLNDKHAIRTELQHLRTNQDQKSWATALVEYTYSPHWFIAVIDQYNYANDEKVKRIHYVTGSVGYIKNSNRIMLSYGRQRAGIFCVGGVCRNVPASNGITLSITSSF